MKFQVGDQVVVFLSNEEGRVVEIINDKMVLVEVRGVKFPAYTDQLDFPYFKRFTEKKLFPETKAPKKFIDAVPKEKKTPVQKIVDGFWITFVPVFKPDEFGDDMVDSLKIHLVNRTAQNYNFTYTHHLLGVPEFQLKNTIHAFEDFYIHDIDFENLNDSPAFHLECSLPVAQKGKADHYESMLKPKARQLFQRIEKLRESGEATFSYKLFDEYPDKVEEPAMDMAPLSNAGFKVYSASSARRHLEPPKYELDLHIEKLSKEHSRMNNFEMLTLQLKTLEKYIDLAVAHHLPSMIVIHGIGKGKLRDEIHEALRMRSDVKSFVNRYHPAYGYGATEIFFK